MPNSSIDLYSAIERQFRTLEKDFDKLLPKAKDKIITLIKGGVKITIDFNNFKPKE